MDMKTSPSGPPEAPLSGSLSGAPGIDPDSVWPIGKKAAMYSCAVVFLLGIFDFIDRQVVAALLPYIKAEWNLSDTQLGMLVSVVNISISILVVPSAYFIDKWSRKKMIALMGGVWSLATAACAFAGSYSHLLVARVFIGAGEAGYNPAAQALIAAQFPKNRRGTAIALTQLGMGLGAPLGLILGAWVASNWGWRHAFGVVAIPGFILSIMALFIKDYKTVEISENATSTVHTPASAEQKAKPKSSMADYIKLLGTLIRTPSLICVFVGATLKLLRTGAGMNWMPSYMMREGGLTAVEASSLAALLFMSSLISMVCIGPIIDMTRRRWSNGIPMVMAACFLLQGCLQFIAFEFLPAASIQQVSTLFISGIFAGGMVAGFSTIIVDLVHPGARATAISLMVLCQNILGFALGPLVVGLLSDHFSLGTAMSMLSFAPILAGVAFVICYFTYQRDAAKVAHVDLKFEG